MSDASSRLASALSRSYRIERELGQGGMATVYLAHDLKHDRQVAIKVLRPELASVLGAERFLQEIRLTARLRHPHILPLYDSGAVDGTLFYVTPLVEGGSLKDRLARDGRLPVGGSHPHRTGGRGRAGVRPPARRDPSRHQARQHSAGVRPRDRRRFRHRAGHLGGRRQSIDPDRVSPSAPRPT